MTLTPFLRRGTALFPLLGILMLALLPGVSLAQSGGGSSRYAWDLWVMGNGAAIADIMTAVKLMLLPSIGGSVSPLRMLMLLVSTIGVVVLAVGAATAPTKNLPRLIGYIFVAWIVVFGSGSWRANLTINDPVTGYHNTVTDVPAIVAIPASLISQVGHKLTTLIEANFNIPGLTLTDVGQFNIFGKVMADATNYRIANPGLKQSLTAYMSDCVIPAIARGKMSTQDLMTSTNLWQTLEHAVHPGIMTTYWSPGTADRPGAFGLGSGQLLSCTNAYEQLAKDLPVHGDELLNAASKSWAATGTLVPLETAMSSVLAQATQGGRGGANMSKPQGFILQNAMVNATSGSMRTAAMMAGNSELMQATAIAQAETSQRSTWIAAAKLFENMTGYVYTVLQAFIFAIAPVILVALLIPGLGKGIFTNYGQILIWLTLWAPLLALINYLVVVFAREAFVGSWGAAGGITMQSAGLVSEQTNNLIAAAQFMGTMVPLITWGLVKGTLAFTEFIQAGIGSSFASQAGAQAATGNVSMGNMSMDNTSMNKYNTALSSSVGAMATEAFAGATALNMRAQSGGSTMANAAGMEAMQRKVEQTLYKGQAISKTDAEAIQAQSSRARSLSAAVKQAQSETGQHADAAILLHAIQKATGMDDRKGMSASQSLSQDERVGGRAGVDAHTGSKIDASVGAKGFGMGGAAAYERGTRAGTGSEASTGQAYDEKTAMDAAKSYAESNGITDSSTVNAISTFLVASSRALETGSSESMSQAASALSSSLQQRADSLSSSLSTSVSYTSPGGADSALMATGQSDMNALYGQQSAGLRSELDSIVGNSSHLGGGARDLAGWASAGESVLANASGPGITPGGALPGNAAPSSAEAARAFGGNGTAAPTGASEATAQAAIDAAKAARTAQGVEIGTGADAINQQAGKVRDHGVASFGENPDGKGGNNDPLKGLGRQFDNLAQKILN